MSCSRRTGRLALAMLMSVAVPAGAQELAAARIEVNVVGQGERADGPVSGYNATRSSTFTKTDTPLKEVPASITVVPSELMEDAGMRSLADVIRYVPGANVHQGEGNRDQFILRGISTSADLFVDGIRDDAQVFRDLYNLDRVEVLKGTAGMIFGRGGAGGVVNRITKKPEVAPIRDGSLSVGSWGDVRATADLGGEAGEHAAWRFNAMGERSDSFRDGFTMRRYAVNPTFATDLAPRTRVILGYEHLDDDRTADRGFPSRAGRPLDAASSTFFGNADQSDARSSFDSAYAVLEHDLGGGQIRNSLRATYYDKRYQNVYPDNANTSAVDDAGNFKLAAYNNANRRTNVFNQTDLTTRVQTGGIEHRLLLGMELGHQDSRNKRNTGFFGANADQLLASVPVDMPYAVATAFRPNGTDADNRVEADIVAFYAQDQVALTPEWKLLAGLRFDHFRTTFDDRRVTTPAVDLARTDNDWSPRVGVIWTPRPASSYYASYSYSFLPSAEQLSLAVNTASLEPETAKNYELGARWDLQRDLMLSAALFRLDRDDVRSPDPLNPGFFLKTGQQRTDGVELGIQGNVTRAWRVFGGYAYLHGRITQATSTAAAGAVLQLVPEHTFSLWNQLAIDSQWSGGLGLIYQSSSFATLDNRVELPGFTRVDGAVSYTFAEGRARVALNLENLLDRRYFPTADGNNNLSPGAPRNARLSLSMML